jgi:hypothetical protein
MEQPPNRQGCLKSVNKTYTKFALSMHFYDSLRQSRHTHFDKRQSSPLRLPAVRFVSGKLATGYSAQTVSDEERFRRTRFRSV